MSLTIELSTKEENSIRRQAAIEGISPEEYIRKRLSPPRRSGPRRAKRPEVTPAATQHAGAALWDELEAAGVLAGYGDPSIDSVDLARHLSSTFSRTGKTE